MDRRCVTCRYWTQIQKSWFGLCNPHGNVRDQTFWRDITEHHTVSTHYTHGGDCAAWRSINRPKR